MFLGHVKRLGVSILGILMLIASAQAASACDAETGCYGALAVGMWRTASGQARVAAGSAHNYPSPDEAYSAAIRNCSKRGYNCQVVTAFSNGGCGFISTGSSYSGVGWGSGASRRDALNQCRVQGLDCGEPIGGCAARPSSYE